MNTVFPGSMKHVRSFPVKQGVRNRKRDRKRDRKD
jgi:hypothetical protein